MDMHSRNQYLEKLQERYFRAESRKGKSSILDEYCRNASQNRKYVIRKINHQDFSESKEKKKRKLVYDGQVTAALAELWEIFDYPCGQRLAPLLKTEVDRLRKLKELLVSAEVAEKLKRIAPPTIDRKLKHQKEVLHQERKYQRKSNSLIYQKIPIRAGDWDRSLVGQVEIDLVEHCGASASGQFVNSVSVVDIATGWWEGEGIMGRAQGRTFDALANIRERMPFDWIEIHPDNDSVFINWHLVGYAKEEGIRFSRSRPYRKNDNSFVEQKNSTHIRGVFGHLRYDTDREIEIINSLYRGELRLYKNFFQPVMKLKEKIRDKGRVHRKYDAPKTPYRRLMESEQVSKKTKKHLQALYLSLNPAELKREIEAKTEELYCTYEEKSKAGAIPFKRQTPRMVTNYMIQQPVVGLPT